MKPTLWLKREWQRFFASHLLIILTLVLGASGLFLIGKLKASFLLSIQRQQRELLSSDLALGVRRPLSAEEIQRFTQFAGKEITAQYRIIEMSSMLSVPEKDLSHLVEVRVVGPGFPFYGALKTKDGPQRLEAEHPLFSEGCLLLSQELQNLLELKGGEVLKLGEASFVTCGTVVEDSTQGFRGFALAPRLYIGEQNLARTGLVGEGSIAYYTHHLKLTPRGQLEAESWKLAYNHQSTDNALRVRTPRDASEQMARSGDMLGDYLQLASLVALLLSVVGGFYLFRSLLHRRLRDIAILRALGLAPPQLRWLLVLPLLCDFLISLPLAAGLAQLIYPVLTRTLGELFGAQFADAPFPSEWLWQAPLILLVVLSALMPAVQEALRVPVRVLLQDQEQVPVLPWRSFGPYLILTLGGLTALAMAVSHSFKTGGLFALGLVASILLFLSVAWPVRAILTWVLRQGGLRGFLGLEVGLVLRRLTRRSVPSLLTLIALGLGATLISLLAHLEFSLGREFTLGAETRPSLFLFDIQDEQTGPLKQFLAEERAPVLAVSPMVRGAITAVNGAPFKQGESETQSFRTREQETETRFRQRVMNLSWATGLNSSETLVAGQTFAEAKVPAGEVALSLERRFAERLKLKLHDQIVFDVMGVPITARVVNIRNVRWTSFLPNFFITFAPGALEEAPKSWLAAVGQMPKAQLAQLQNKLAKRFSNVSAADLGQIVNKLMELFLRLKQALVLMAWFAFFVGVVVVLAIAQDQILRRQSEFMLEKTLGLSPAQVTLMVLGESILMGLIALTLGTLAGAGLAAAITSFAFQASPVWDLGFMIKQVLLGTTITILPLLVAAKRIFTLRPAGLLQSP